jgi:2'-5' RNA ligase
MERIRSFIAIELPDPLKEALDQLESRLKTDRQPYVKWVDPASIHLTLKFLGSISADSVAEITRAIGAAVAGTAPFRLRSGTLGVFPNPKRVQVVWVGLEGELDQLNRLQQKLEASLSPLGFPPERRRFTPHLTLARLRDRASAAEREEMGKLVAETGLADATEITVDTVSLMKSELTRTGPIYTRISRVELT